MPGCSSGERGGEACPLKPSQGMEELVDYAAGRLEAESRRRLEAHLAVCAPCRWVVSAQKGVWDALGAWEVPEASPGFDAAVLRRIAMEKESVRGRRWLGWVGRHWKAAAAVGVAAIVLVVGVWFRLAGVAPSPAGTEQVHAPAAQAEAAELERDLEDLEMLRAVGSPAGEDL